MKKILTLGLIIASHQLSFSQNYVPLLLDSLYTWSQTVDIHGDTLTSESWRGYSYDQNDILIQTRTPSTRFNYFYATDTVILISETLDGNNEWNTFSKNTTAYEQGRVVSKLTQTWEEDEFVNSARQFYHYEDLNLNTDTLFQIEHWNEDNWKSFYKKEKIFDTNGNTLEEGEFYTNEDGEFEYNRGKLFEYDELNNKIQEIGIISTINGEHYTKRTNWIYDNNNLLDTIKRCDYSFPDYIDCDNDHMTSIEYWAQDSITRNNYNWQGNEWNYYGKELTHLGDQVYSNRPDSIIYHWFDPTTETHLPTTLRYFQYEDIGNNTIYFREEQFRYFMSIDEYELTKLREEWYSLQNPVSIEKEIEENISCYTFPNPSISGEYFSISNNSANVSDIEVLIFDVHGKLVKRIFSENNSKVAVELDSGFYSILIKEENKLIGVSKHIVIEK